MSGRKALARAIASAPLDASPTTANRPRKRRAVLSSRRTSGTSSTKSTRIATASTLGHGATEWRYGMALRHVGKGSICGAANCCAANCCAPDCCAPDCGAPDCCGLHLGQGEDEGRSPLRVHLVASVAAVRADKLAHDEQAEPGAGARRA